MLCGGIIPAKYDNVYLNHMNDHHRAFINIDFLFHASLLSADKLTQLRDAIKKHAVDEREYDNIDAIKTDIVEQDDKNLINPKYNNLSSLSKISLELVKDDSINENSEGPEEANEPTKPNQDSVTVSAPPADEMEAKSPPNDQPRRSKKGRAKKLIKEKIKDKDKRYRSLAEVKKRQIAVGCKCEINFKSIKARIRHIQVVHNNWVACDSCVAVFRTEELMLTHSAKLHPNGPKTNKSNVCGECGFVVSNWWKMSSHVAFYHDDRVYKCDTCGVEKQGKQRFKKHVKGHLRKDREFQPKECPDCKKIVKNMPLHQQNVHLIDELKPFSCEDCGKRFGVSKALKEHMVIHTNVRAFNCRYGCGFASKTAGNRTKHEIQKHKAKSEKDIKSEMEMKQENN